MAGSAGSSSNSPSVSPINGKREALSYGPPLVMNCAITNEYAFNPDSGQLKALFNHIVNLERLFTNKDAVVVTANSEMRAPRKDYPVARFVGCVVAAMMFAVNPVSADQ